MKNHTASVVGSWRPYDNVKYGIRGTFEEFEKACFHLGYYLACQNNISQFVINISNDYLVKQSMPRYVNNVPVLNENNEVVCEYYYQHTADYIAMLGYLCALKDNELCASKKKVKVYISYFMKNGCVSEFGNIMKPFLSDPVFNHVTQKEIIIDNEYAKYLDFELIEDEIALHEISRIKNSDSLDFDLRVFWSEKLRSELLQQYIVPNITTVITIGGGKATQIFYNGAKANEDKKRIEFLPLPFFKGKSLKYFCEGVENEAVFCGKKYNVIFSKMPTKSDIDFINCLPEEKIDKPESLKNLGGRFSLFEENFNAVDEILAIVNEAFDVTIDCTVQKTKEVMGAGVSIGSIDRGSTVIIGGKGNRVYNGCYDVFKDTIGDRWDDLMKTLNKSETAKQDFEKLEAELNKNNPDSRMAKRLWKNILTALPYLNTASGLGKNAIDIIDEVFKNLA